VSSQIVNLKAAGLQTYYQSLMEISPGALLKADNVVINRSGIIEPRRGIATYGNSFGSSTTRIKQLLQYNDTLIRHIGDKLSYDNGSGVFTDFLNTYSEPIGGYRIKHAEAKSNFYFTTNSGVKKISAKTFEDFSSPAIIRNIGCPKALSATAKGYYDGEGFLPKTSTGALTSDYFVAYRILWVYTDKNENLNFGAPSDRCVGANLGRKYQASMQLDFPIPEDITEEYKYRIYRSEVTAGTTPSDELNLVYEASPTASQLASGVRKVSYIDRVQEDVRVGGTPLYTNQYSGEGIQNSNEVPPLANDITVFNGHMFYANTKSKQYSLIELLKVKDGTTGSDKTPVEIKSGISDFYISSPDITSKYIFEGSRNSFSLRSPATASFTNMYSYLTVRSANDERKYRLEIYNVSGTTFMSPPLFGEDGTIDLGRLTIPSAATTAEVIMEGIRSAFYQLSSAVFDFDISVSTTTATNDTLTFTNNSNGVCTAPSTVSWMNYSLQNLGKGEDFLNNKILLSNGFNPSASVNGCSWTSGTSTITCPSVIGFVVGRKVMSGNRIPDGATITAITGNVITISKNIISTVSNNPGAMLIQLSDTDLSIEQTCKSMVRVINANNTSLVNAYYISNAGDAPGKMYFQHKVYSDTAFYMGTSDLEIVNFFTPELGIVYTNSSITTTNPAVITTSSNHGLISSDSVLIFGSSVTTAFPDVSNSINGINKASLLSNNTYSISKSITAVSSNGQTITLKLKSKQDAISNRLYYSKYQEHEAVPLLNYLDVGSADSEILRIVALKESLFIFKKDGIYRLTGNAGTSPVWDVSIFDNTIIVIAPDSVVKLANDCYLLTNQGYVKVNESALIYLSPSIENKILPFINTGTSIATSSFSIAYESDRCLLAWTISSKKDLHATVCYRFNIMTQTWTEWNIPKTCGILHDRQDKLYFGSGSDNYMEVERKDFTRLDYADRDIEISLIANPEPLRIKTTNYSQISVGDVIAQKQYVTISQFNSLLKKLDLDLGLNVESGYSFYNALKMKSMDNLTVQITGLVNKLNVADTSTSYSSLWTSPTLFSSIQTEYNLIINALNLSNNTRLHNYKTSTKSFLFETVVTHLDNFKNEIAISSSPQFVSGPLTLYKAIRTEIEYAPQHAGDVAGHKQFSTGTFLFERRSFKSATVSYNSDISDNYEEVDISLNYSGTFGAFEWGQDSVWGGKGDQAHVRTYIPLKKQKCRFLGCKFVHNTALESYQLYGISLSVRLFTIKDRNYK
jgi:hypothetical protein